MKKISRIWLLIALVAVLVGSLAFNTRNAAAAGHTFNISVYHAINGKDLGLSKALPVIASVYKDNVLLATIPLEYKERFSTDLPPGNYKIMVTSVEAGPLPSMTVGPVDIVAGSKVRAQAQLGAGQTPILNVRITEGSVAPSGFNISVYHGINGKSLGLSRDLPVTAAVYKDGSLLANIPLEFKDRFSADLPAGTYTIYITSAEAGFLPSMTVGPVFIPEGVKVRASAQLQNNQVPVVSVRIID